MKIKSLMNQNGEWRPIEVEVSLRKGIAAVKFLGLPDTVAKESVDRLKPAFAKLGISWPNTRIITINLRPTYLRKSSKGLDLPIALGIMAEMGIDEQLVIDEEGYYYGEVDLEGRVHMPDDLAHFLPLKKDTKVVTGKVKAPQYCEVEQMQEINAYTTTERQSSREVAADFKRPTLSDLMFDQKTARLLMILAAGEHHTLLAGPAGSGKTTLARAANALLRRPSEVEARSIQRMQSRFAATVSWRPLVQPHHTTPVISMLGGSYPVTPGELSRAHGGQLVLDEMLEFAPTVLEALREPLDNGFMVASRRGVSKKFPASFQLIATTNLCPCGKYVPRTPVNCRFSLRKCRSTIEKLSGPLLDRFDILAYSNSWTGEKKHSLQELMQKLEEVYQFQKLRGAVPINRKLEELELKTHLHRHFKVIDLPNLGQSHRRSRALLRVARSIADLELSEKIQLAHVEEAKKLTMLSFYDLEKM